MTWHPAGKPGCWGHVCLRAPHRVLVDGEPLSPASWFWNPDTAALFVALPGFANPNEHEITVEQLVKRT